MNTRLFPRLSQRWSEIGYGMWGLAGWTGNDDKQTFESLSLAVENGVNFFDTAWAYGNGKSEEMLGKLLKEFSQKRLYTGSKIPPKNLKWPASKIASIKEVFPKQHILEYAGRTLDNLKIATIDLLQFHVWTDEWAQMDEWKEAIEDLKSQKMVKSFGISVNRWEPTNVLKTLDSKLIACVQVVYNIFDQNPEDELFPYCLANQIGIIARVPFDEGSLTGTLNSQTRFPVEDWRHQYFNSDNLAKTLPRIEEIKKDLPDEMAMAEMALRFILQHEAVTTVIPGMRQARNVLTNVKAGDGNRLSNELYDRLKRHRWNRTPDQNKTA